MNDKYLYCYSARMKAYLMRKGFRYICVGLNERAGSRFWLFEKTPKLGATLDEYEREKAQA